MLLLFFLLISSHSSIVCLRVCWAGGNHSVRLDATSYLSTCHRRHDAPLTFETRAGSAALVQSISRVLATLPVPSRQQQACMSSSGFQPVSDEHAAQTTNPMARTAALPWLGRSQSWRVDATSPACRSLHSQTQVEGHNLIRTSLERPFPSPSHCALDANVP
jgi:hypothetical protein